MSSECDNLTSEHWAALEALVNRIIPADDYPDGWSAGVGDYLARQFRGDLAGCIPAYAAGLAALDRESLAAAQVRFAEIPPSAQDELLARIESGAVVADWPIDPLQFFNMAVSHVMEGYYADPENGGNRDEISWRMIGFTVTG